MKKWIKVSLIFAFLVFSLAGMAQQQRFPKPEFGTGYSQPTPVTPEPLVLELEEASTLLKFGNFDVIISVSYCVKSNQCKGVFRF